MVDRERILARLDDLEQFLRELRQIAPATFEEYRGVEKRRSCERLLQIAIESVIDICHVFVTGLRLGLPAEEDDLIEKLEQAKVISQPMCEVLRKMKGLRNILVHEYGRVNDQIIYEIVKSELRDFENFTEEIRQALRHR